MNKIEAKKWALLKAYAERIQKENKLEEERKHGRELYRSDKYIYYADGSKVRW